MAFRLRCNPGTPSLTGLPKWTPCPGCCLAQHSNLAHGHGPELRIPAPLEEWGGDRAPRRVWSNTASRSRKPSGFGGGRSWPKIAFDQQKVGFLIFLFLQMNCYDATSKNVSPDDPKFPGCARTFEDGHSARLGTTAVSFVHYKLNAAFLSLKGRSFQIEFIVLEICSVSPSFVFS